ncbi:MAG TPA: cation:proton antiporter family protein [Gammaproteobacteria bacterium]
MAGSWIAAALVLGLLAWRTGLPPLVGFLVCGFVLGALGMETTPALEQVAHAGVLLLLFAVGLKLRLKTLMRYEVWGTAVAHLVIVSAVVAVPVAIAGGLPVMLTIALAVALNFSSTVFAAKVLEDREELRAVHGRVAIGILIVQDIAAVALLALLNGERPSPYALLLLALPFARPLIARLLTVVGHGELFVLLGAALALAVGGEGFERLGLSPELGALVLGMMLANHPRAHELSGALWSLKELLLIGFFLSIGMSGTPTWVVAESAALLLVLMPLKAGVFFFLLLLLGLRARTSLLTALSLSTFSEFGLIVTQLAVDNGMLDQRWLTAAGIAVALSFAVAAPLNARAHALYALTRRWLDCLERDKRHPDDEPITFGSAEILVVGMGRVGTGAFDYLRAQGKHVVGVDSDTGKLERHRREGRRVAYADAEDPNFWLRLKVDRLQLIMLAMPDLEAKLRSIRELRRRGFEGMISATHVYPDELAPLLEAGCDASYNYFSEAGYGFARHTLEALSSPDGTAGTVLSEATPAEEGSLDAESAPASVALPMAFMQQTEEK